jgi:hypothetical protein
MAETVSQWQKEETPPYNLHMQRVCYIHNCSFSHVNWGADLIYDLNWASLGKNATSELGFQNVYPGQTNVID